MGMPVLSDALMAFDFAVCVVIGIVLLAGIPLMWRGRRGWAEEMPAYWRWGERSWYGMLIAYAPGAVGSALCFAAYGVMEYTSAHTLGLVLGFGWVACYGVADSDLVSRVAAVPHCASSSPCNEGTPR